MVQRQRKQRQRETDVIRADDFQGSRDRDGMSALRRRHSAETRKRSLAWRKESPGLVTPSAGQPWLSRRNRSALPRRTPRRRAGRGGRSAGRTWRGAGARTGNCVRSSDAWIGLYRAPMRAVSGICGSLSSRANLLAVSSAVGPDRRSERHADSPAKPGFQHRR